MQRFLPKKQGAIMLLIATLFMLPLTMLAQNRQVSGTVIDATTNQPVIGVSITIPGKTSGGTTTDANGKFSLEAPVGTTLTISSLGYAEQTVKVPASGDIVIKLEISRAEMNEVVVIGYGQARKKDLTGAITQIKPDKLADQNPNTVQDILRGTPGLSVGLDPSAKGGGSIQIRGQRSVYTEAGHNDPLIVLDGMIFYGELSEINPDDIAQIDILKDASASAIYGAKSANGVLIVTTKKGQKGKPKISFTTNLGLATMGANRPVFGPEGYMQYREDWYTAATYGLNSVTNQYEAYQVPLSNWNGNKRPGFYAPPTEANLAKYGVTLDQWRAYTTNNSTNNDEVWAKRLVLQDTVLNRFLGGRTFDWYDHSFRTGISQDYNLSASGGTDNMNYYMSLGYLSNQSAVKGDDYKAIRANLKVEGKIAKWLEIGGNINFQNRTDGNLAVDWGRQIINNAPYAAYRNEATGALLPNPMGRAMVNNFGYNYDFDRGYRDLDKGFTVFNAILTTKVKLPFNITYSFNASPRFQHFRDRYWESSSHPDWGTTNGLVNREQTQRFDWSLNNTINWEQTFAGKHRVAVTLVQEAENRQVWTDRVQARDIKPSDALGFHEVFYGNKDRSSYDANDVKETADGMLARVFYAFDDRYMITSSFRRDGYSAFGTSNPRANFFSIAGAWTFTNESFFKWEPMTTGKLRASWGQNGNRSLADPYLAIANLGAGAGATMGYLDASGNLVQYRYLSVSRLANPNLSWEKTESMNFGLDFGFLNDRITGSVDYYITPTVDMIMNRTLPQFSGVSSITTNLGKVENRGIEVTINSTNIRNKDFTWTTTVGFSKYKNTIQHLQFEYENVLDDQGNIIGTRERDVSANNWFIGQPISAIWNYNVTGIWQAHEAEEAKAYGQRPGDPKVANNYTADDPKDPLAVIKHAYNDKDKEFLGQTAPPIMWSMRNDFTWKNFNFSFNLYSYWGHKSLNGIYLNQDNGTSLVTNLANAYAKDYWTPENPSNVVGRLDAKGPSGVNAPGRLYDRSFIRLENITVGYLLPKNIVSKAGIEKLKFYAAVRNVAVWQKDKTWDYWDIETGGMAPRLYTFGLNANF